MYVHRSSGKSCCVGREGAACGEGISSLDLVGNALPAPTLQTELMLAGFVACGAWLLFAQRQDVEGMEGQMFLQLPVVHGRAMNCISRRGSSRPRASFSCWNKWKSPNEKHSLVSSCCYIHLFKREAYRFYSC